MGQDSHGAAADRTGRFMNRAEEEFARLLDYYPVEWQYEPRSFPLKWDSEARVMEAFTPDFFLPEQTRLRRAYDHEAEAGQPRVPQAAPPA